MPNTVTEKPTIISISNQKGGVGKTTTASNLARGLANYGKKILMIDLDPQGNLGTSFGISYADRVEKNMFNVFINLIEGSKEIESIINQSILKTYVDGIDIICSNMDLATLNIEEGIKSKEFLLKYALSYISNYDLIIVDCPPTISLLSINALTASDYVIVPMQCEYLALEGLVQLMKVIDLIQENYNSDINLLGIVLTMHGKTKLSESVINDVRTNIPEAVFDISIPRTIKITESQSHGKCLMDYDKRAIASYAYLQLAKEVIERLERYSEMPTSD